MTLDKCQERVALDAVRRRLAWLAHRLAVNSAIEYGQNLKRRKEHRQLQKVSRSRDTSFVARHAFATNAFVRAEVEAYRERWPAPEVPHGA